ncbi:uncharacterized protein LOC113351934 [Papaver somniferum]|uniref:uncharacterized protein LOC113351934 n=1 Tax=Papaver somniferum TaxID=3469 RepID=UPI000E704647|nr:uncharacterized protein LOC113351934 [Papaver somniferum]
MQLEDYSYPFCKQQPETDMHILLQCNLAKSIWFALLPEAMHSQQKFNSLQKWVKSWNHAQSIISFKNENNILLATVIMWQIWKSRCITVFEEKLSHPNNIIISIKQFCMKYNILGSETNPIGRNNNSKPKDKWKKPPKNWWKLNFDAAFDKDTNTCGIGLILRDCAGRFVEAMVKVTKARDVEQGEGLALLEAVEWVRSRNWKNVIIEGDCKTVIEVVTSNFGNSSWQDHNLLSDISRLVEACSNIICTFFPRTGNEAANGLAKYAKRYECNQVWSVNPPRCIHSILELDNSM